MAPTWHELMLDADAEARRRRRRTAYAVFTLGIVIVLTGVALIAVPLTARWQASREQSDVITQSEQTVSGWPWPQAEEALAAARAYNERLARSGQPVLGEAIDPFARLDGESSANDSDASKSSQDMEYQSLLNTGNGVMGSIRIPRISVNLPILHGTSTQVLEQGAGHLYGTSLPAGSADSHAVITGHRGLVQTLMFTRLDEMQVGDVFYIDVMGHTFGYRVDRISVIDPNDSSLLRVTPGEDRVTLMTCTPYGVNTHRLLVSGVRANIPQDIPAEQDAPRDVRDAAWKIAAVCAAVTLLLWIPIARRNGWAVMRHASGNRP